MIETLPHSSRMAIYIFTALWGVLTLATLGVIVWSIIEHWNKPGGGSGGPGV